MLRKCLYFLLFLSGIAIFTSCSKDKEDEVLPLPEENDEFVYEWEKNRTELLVNNDMVLLYAGGAHRTYGEWDQESVKPYVTYKDESGQEHWLFDSFLFLEFFNGVDKAFVTGYYGDPANQQDWKKLLDHYFRSENCMGALDKAIVDAKKRLGEPEEKRKVMIGIPEPMQTQSAWGSVENGIILDFLNRNDRVAAVKWYIDYARKKFEELNYENLELAGFYWVPEAATYSRAILEDISSYLNDLKYSFEWIPYHYADGAFDWKDFGFNYTYYQPNYFFNEDRPLALLNSACEAAIEYDMSVEMEFDARVLAAHGWGYRLEEYMLAFKRYGLWETKRIAYYQGDKAVLDLAESTEEADQQLYHKFCKFVIERRK